MDSLNLLAKVLSLSLLFPWGESCSGVSWMAEELCCLVCLSDLSSPFLSHSFSTSPHWSFLLSPNAPGIFPPKGIICAVLSSWIAPYPDLLSFSFFILNTPPQGGLLWPPSHEQLTLTLQDPSFHHYLILWLTSLIALATIQNYLDHLSVYSIIITAHFPLVFLPFQEKEIQKAL